MAAEAVDQKKPINRREFLNFAWLASLGFLLVDLAGVTYLFSMPRFKEGEFGGVFTVGPSGSLPSTENPPTNLPKVKVWLSNTEEGVTALYKVCTHLGCLYNWSNQEGRFICPCHGSEFEKNGTYLRGPAPRDLDRFVIRFETPEGDVLAATDEEVGGPVPVPEDSNAILRIDTGKRILGARRE